MYMKSYGDPDGMQSFRRGEYTIPVNYRGNAFSADEPPTDCMDEPAGSSEPTYEKEVEAVCDKCSDSLTDVAEHAEADTKPCADNRSKTEEKGLFNLFGFSPRFDDLLLIGLILLLLHENGECEGKNSDVIPILVILLLFGF